MPYQRTTVGAIDTYARSEGYTAADRGWLAENYPIGPVANQTAIATAGRMEVARVRLPVAAQVTNVITYSTTGGSSLTAGQCFAVLYSGAGARIGVTADQAAAWASSGLKVMPLASGPFSCAPGDYYVAFWFNGTTGPAFIRHSVSGGANQFNAGFSAPNLLHATADTGLTTTAPATMGAQSAAAVAYWVALS